MNENNFVWMVFYYIKTVHRSKKGRRQPTCMVCIPIEAVCFVYGIISCVLSVFGIVILTLARLFVPFENEDNIIVQYTENMLEETFEWTAVSSDVPVPGLYDNLPLTVYGLFLYVGYIGSIVFSVLLCYGTLKRNPGYLKVYLVYGVTVTTLMLLSLVYLYSWLDDTVGFTVMGITCCIYSLVLRVVHRTYLLFYAERAYHLAQLRRYIEK